MIVTPLEYTPDYLAYRGERPSGVHLTDCIAYIDRHLNPKRNVPSALKRLFEADDDEYAGWEWAAPLGFAWEDFMIQQLENEGVSLLRGKDLVQQCDGIWLSPDAFDASNWRLWEFKFTWKWTTTLLPEHNWKWMMQVRGYCYALGCTEAVIAPMYVVGNGKFPAPTPLFRLLQFTEQELAENWRALCSARDQLEKGVE